MDTTILVAVISAAASLSVAAITFFLTKRKEREADCRKQELKRYRELLDALSGVVGSDATPEGRRRWARATNTIGLVASQQVLLPALPVPRQNCEVQPEAFGGRARPCP